MTESEKTESWVPQEDFQVDCEDELDLQQSSSADLSDELDELVISDDDVLDEDDGKVEKKGYKACLLAHNEKRKLHKDTPPMKLSIKLCKQAQEGAESLARRNAFAHDTENYGCGENIWWRSPPRSDRLTREMSESYCTSAVNSWYSEIEDYSFRKHGKKSNNAVVGHFTQLVWKESVKLGVGIAKRRDGKYVVLCRYSPRGNVNMKKNLPIQVGDLK